MPFWIGITACIRVTAQRSSYRDWYALLNRNYCLYPSHHSEEQPQGLLCPSEQELLLVSESLLRGTATQMPQGLLCPSEQESLLLSESPLRGAATIRDCYALLNRNYCLYPSHCSEEQPQWLLCPSEQELLLVSESLLRGAATGTLMPTLNQKISQKILWDLEHAPLLIGNHSVSGHFTSQTIIRNSIASHDLGMMQQWNQTIGEGKTPTCFWNQ
jgi:hypothetical protein